MTDYATYMIYEAYLSLYERGIHSYDKREVMGSNIKNPKKQRYSCLSET